MLAHTHMNILFLFIRIVDAYHKLLNLIGTYEIVNEVPHTCLRQFVNYLANCFSM